MRRRDCTGRLLAVLLLVVRSWQTGAGINNKQQTPKVEPTPQSNHRRRGRKPVPHSAAAASCLLPARRPSAMQLI